MMSLLSVQLVAILVYLFAASAVLCIPTKSHRERRQTFDFSNNTGDNEHNTSLGNFPNDANSSDDGFDLSDLEDLIFGPGTDDTTPSMDNNGGLNGNDTDSSPPHSFLPVIGSTDGEDEEGNGPELCDVDCVFPCLTLGQCDGFPQCVNYSCPVDSLEPVEGDRCEHSDWICVHGKCIGKTNCICDKGWIGVQCRHPCTLDCGEDGECLIINHNKPANEITEKDMQCNCKNQIEGQRCESIKPDRVAEAKSEGRKVAVILGCCLVVAIVISVILPIVLWRRRVIFVMRMVYFFKMWEDNDGKIYDAYISVGTTRYASRFVNTFLVPRLQSKGFKLYIPSRDQLGGDLLSEDILTAINQSRRTIMVVTPDYLKNEWSRFEALNAQVETIKLQQRIIPIILEDVSQEKPHMQRSLRHILDSVKCLKVPQSDSTKEQSSISAKKMVKFWRRLELTMPKTKTAVNSNSDYGVGSNLSEKSHSNNIYNENAIVDQKDKFVEVDLNDINIKNNGPIIDLKINPLSLYENNSINYQEIDPSKYEQCFSMKNDL